MKDFKKKNLYNNEIGLFQAVIDQRIETMSEYNRVGRYRIGNEEEDEDTKLLGSAFDMDSFGSDGGWGDFGMGADALGSFGGYQSGIGSEYEQSLPKGEWDNLRPAYIKVLMSPVWAMNYFFRGLMHDNPFKAPSVESEDGSTSDDTTHNYTSDLFKGLAITGVVMGVLALLQLTGYIRVMLAPNIGYVAIALGILIDFINHYHYKGGFITEFLQDDEDEDTLLEGDGSESELGLGDEGIGTDNEFSGFGLGGSDDLFGDFGGFGDFNDDGGDSLSDRYADFDDGEDEDDGDVDFEELDNQRVARLFPTSPVNTRGDDSEFDSTLLDVFRDGNRHKGKMYRKRSDILKTYAPYLPSNDDSFSKWYEIKEHSPEYDNIAFTLYKALVQINNKFAIENGSKEKLTVFSMKRTPLIYKIEVKLPSYFKESQVLSSTKQFNNYLKKSDDDIAVGSLISTFNGNYIFKFLRLDARGLISYGDIARYENPETGDAPVDDLIKDKGIPVLLGLRDNEYPFTFDLEANTSGVIVGGSGSGKSWLTFQLMMSMLTTNTPEELNFLVLDAKNAAIWKQFAKAPHVIGYHTDIFQYIEILNEINAEHLRRQELLSQYGVEDFKTLREDLKSRGDYEALAQNPFLVVVVDEITYTMTTLRDHDKDLYDSLKAIMSSLSAVVRSSGIRLLLIGQRSIDTSIPKSVMANSSMKFGMKMNAITDYGPMFGDEYKQVSRVPSSAGEGLISLEGMANIEYIKTLVPGGTSTPQLMRVIRVVALDWVRRTIGTGFDYYRLPGEMNDTIKLGFNRDNYYADSLGDLRDGRILRNQVVNEGYQVNIEEGVPGDTSSRFGLSEQTVIFGEQHNQTTFSDELDNDVLESTDEVVQDFGYLTQDTDNAELTEDDFDFDSDLFEGFDLDVSILDDTTLEEPIIEEPIIEEPVYEEPVIEEPIIEEPMIEEQVIEEPIIEAPTTKIRQLPRGLMGVGGVELPSPFKRSEEPTTEDNELVTKVIESDSLAYEEDIYLDDLFEDTESDNDINTEQELITQQLEDQRKQIELELQQERERIERERLALELAQQEQQERERIIQEQLLAQQQELELLKQQTQQELDTQRNESGQNAQDKVSVKKVTKPIKPSRPKKPVSKVKPSTTESITSETTHEDDDGVRLGIKQYIVKYGTKVDFHTRAVPKEVIQSKYTKREIKVAQQVGQIYATDDAYVASIN